MNEKFAVPCVGAIIEKEIDGMPHVLIQTRQKADGGATNGLTELPAGKVREYEDLFSALRREVREETGLTVTKIRGEDQSAVISCDGGAICSYQPYCVTQNLSGAYSILLHTFLCEAEGELLTDTDESSNIRWIPVEELRKVVREQPETVFFLHLNALRAYLNL